MLLPESRLNFLCFLHPNYNFIESLSLKTYTSKNLIRVVSFSLKSGER